MAKISNITFKNFRIYRDESFVIGSDKNIILLYGRNGTGKSSFFDGIEWGLTGNISRYEDSGTSKTELNRSKTILRNINASNSDSSFVKINFEQGEECTRTVTSYRGCDFTVGSFKSTKQVTAFLVNPMMSDVNFENNFNFSHLLAQEQISDFIRATDENKRFEAIVRLFGLDSYKRFDTHIKDFCKFIVSEKSSIEQEIKKLESEIEKQQTKLFQLGLDPQIAHNRVENWLKRQLKQDEIESLITYINTEYNKIVEQQKTLGVLLTELQTLGSQYPRIEELRKKSFELNSRQKSLESIIDLLNQFENCNKALLLKDSYDASVLFGHDHNSKLDKFNALQSFRKDSPLFKTDTSLFQCIDIVATVRQELNDKKDLLITLETQIEAKKTHIVELKKNIDNLATTSQHLFSCALQYFKAFPETKSCPVCNNQVFNITETENRLRSELELSGNDTLIAAKNILQGEESLVENMQRQYLDLTNITKNIIDEYKKTVVDDFFALSEEITRIREIRLKADQFIELYGKLELPTPIDPVFLLNHTIHVKSELEKHTLFTPGKYGIQYNAELQNTKLELNTSLPEIQQFDGIWKKHAIENITTISEKIQAINTKLDKLSGELGSTESLLKDLTILKTSLGNQMIQNHIDAKTNKKFELTSKLEGLTIVERQYKLFESSVKSTINSELNSKLDLYRKTIGGIFKFLNPHIYMTDLVLDFDPTAGNKGRLYLSVKDDDGNELNPTFTFSAAQNNVLALSIFLSFALKQTWSRLDSIFLDDPIQNMDDINVHAFVDIIRSTIRNKPEKQFFISTHDERVFNFMKNKFGQEKVQVFVFESYGRVKQVGTN